MTTYDPDLAPPADAEEAARARRRRAERIGKWLLPVLVVGLTVWLWDRIVVWNEIPHYILPRPGRVVQELTGNWASLYRSFLVTLQLTFGALAIAVIGGVTLAVLFTQSRWVEMSFFPYAVILQVTPLVAIAPLIFIYVESRIAGLLICAWIVAFFPILSNTTLGLKSVDPNLDDLFSVYGASRWQRLRYLQAPSALPYFLGGLRIAGGLALIGAVVAEYVGGTGTAQGGLAFRILEAGYRLAIPTMFAALLLIALTGVIIFASLSLLSHLLLRRWHESAVARER